MNDCDLEALLRECEVNGPCGKSLLHEHVFDLIRAAGQEDDTQLPQGVWATMPKKADWQEVVRLCTDVLTTQSKDLQVAAWLGEAWLSLDGLENGACAIQLIQALCQRYWPDLHPLPRDGDMEFRTAPLEWIDSKWARAIELRAPLVSGIGVDARNYTLSDWKSAMETENMARKDKAAIVEAQRSGSPIYARIVENSNSMPVSLLQGRLTQVKSMKTALQGLRETLGDLVGVNAPRLATLEKTLDSTEDVLQQALVSHPKYEPEQSETPDSTDSMAGEGAVAERTAALQTLFNGREDAYRKLTQVADYLTDIEPHSPVPSLIRRAIAWGHMPFDDLMRELMRNDGELQRILWQDQK